MTDTGEAILASINRWNDRLDFNPEKEFLDWEAISRDTIEVKRCYIDITGDLATGVLLSQIIYWFLPDKRGEKKTTIERDGRRWIAKKHDEWWEECRIPERSVKRHLAALEEAGLINTQVWKFDGTPTTHITVNFDLLHRLILEKPISQNESGQNGLVDQAKMAYSIRPKWPSPIKEAETTAEITAKTTKANSTDFAELIYDSYPRKVGKLAAIKAIEKALGRVEKESDGSIKTLEDAYHWLLARVTKYAESREGEDEKFTPHPATWFNQGRYLDSIHDNGNGGRTSKVGPTPAFQEENRPRKWVTIGPGFKRD